MAAGFAGDDDGADHAHRRGQHEQCAGGGRDIADRDRGYQDNLASRVMDLQVAVTVIRQAGLARDGG